MARVTKSRPARRDIDQITSYIAGRDGVHPAVRWLSDLTTFFDRIVGAPGMGTSRDKVIAGLRSVPFGDYLVFFRKKRAGIEIVRVIHGACKWERLLKDMK